MGYDYIQHNETKGIEYLRTIARPGWVVTPSEEYCHWDATVAKGEKTYTVENKVRYISKSLAEKGLLLDTEKVGPDIDWYIQYLPQEQEAYVINYEQIQKGIEEGTVTLDLRPTNKQTFNSRDEKVEKPNWLIPITLFRCVSLA